MSEPTIEQKRQFLFKATLNQQLDDHYNFIYSVLWDGYPGPGYAKSTPEEIQEEWDDMCSGLDTEEMAKINEEASRL